MKIIIVSDLHLGNGGAYDIFAGAEALPAMLRAERPDRLIINGDAVDFLLDDLPVDRIDVARAVAQARAIAEHSAGVLRAFGEVPEVVIRLGNHDVELALPEVQAVFERAIVGDGSASVSFVLGDETEPLVEVNGVRVLVTHGEHADGHNRLQYGRLRTRRERFRYPFGSHLVKHGLNVFKREEKARFADLIKPDLEGGLAATALIYPGATATRLAKTLPRLVWAKLAGRTGQTFGDVPDLEVDTDAWKGRVLRWLAGARGARFFELTPTDEEMREVARLRARFDCHAVVMGHTHAARFAGDDLPYVNTGTWIPLIELPDGDVTEAAWTLFLDELRRDPELEGIAKTYVASRFTAAAISDVPTGARLELIEWKQGGRLSLGSTDLQGGPVQHAEPQAEALCFPLMADESGRAVWPGGVVPPVTEPLPASRVRRDRPTGPGTDVNALRDMGWGLIVPAAYEAELRARLAPLLALRARQTGRAVDELDVFTVGASVGETWEDAVAWVEEELLRLDDDKRPQYLLIAGDLDEVPLTLQQALPPDSFVGRIAFTTDAREPNWDAYARYADKVVRHHAARVDGRPEVLLYHVDDATAATRLAERVLVQPATAWLAERGGFSAVRSLSSAGGLTAPCPEDLLEAPGVDGPNVLLTVSHGVAVADAARRHALQGAMSFGEERIEAGDLADRTFLPGGLWMYIACFGGGTPARSVFTPWLQKLAPGTPAAEVLLASLDERPFVAALPQAALANPEGPLGVLAHVDLAWSYGLAEGVERRTKVAAHRRFSEAVAALPAKQAGDRARTFGVAVAKLRRLIRRFDQANAQAQLKDDPGMRAESWMARQDLDGYILLGDPAARLPYGTEEG